MQKNQLSEPPLKPNLRELDPDGFVSVADLRNILRCSRSKIDRMTRDGVHCREAVENGGCGVNDGLAVGVWERPTITAADEQRVDGQAVRCLSLLVITHMNSSYVANEEGDDLTG